MERLSLQEIQIQQDMATTKYNELYAVHFIDGEPSMENPSPTKNLSYKSSSKIKNFAV